MKTTRTDDAPQDAAAIVQVAGVEAGASAADAPAAPERARAFAEPLIGAERLDTGENALAHADGVAAILRGVGAAPGLCASAYLVYAGDYLQRPEEVVAKAFGPSYASLVTLTRQLMQIQRAARDAEVGPARRALQTERVRKMLLAFSRDLRVVLLRLASRLQTLRWHAASRVPCPQALAEESAQVFAPLANRLGIWQVKWELEDLAFRFLQPAEYKRIAELLHETRAARESGVEAARGRLLALMSEAGLDADVQGRPKHLYSIWKKMQGKGLPFEHVFDVRAVRIVVDGVEACYAALARVHDAFEAVDGEFDDYIARPKPNGYQSLHTVVRLDDGRPLEVQIRTRAMHEHAEHGVAAHWMYKEAGARGYAGVSAAGDFEERIAEARKAVLRQLLAWERDYAEHAGPEGAFDDRIYVFTPQATVIELPAGGTPVDFAYALHTDLGHRCRGARVDGVLVPLNTPLKHGQTVEVTAAREGGPSMDWLNPELGYLKGQRSRAKVRAWFNAQAQRATIARGREAVEKLLQREGRTALKHDALAEQLGFKRADDLFEVVGKDEFSLRTIENLLRPAPPPVPDEPVALRRPQSDGRGGVLVVGMGSLMTTLSRCCRPAPPDDIRGYVTRGKGVAIHRAACPNFRHMAERDGARVIDVAWRQDAAGAARPAGAAREALYPLDVLVEASERPALVRDVSEVFAREKMNVVAVSTQAQGRAGGVGGRPVRLTITVEVADTARLHAALAQIARLPGIQQARRR